MVASEPQTAGEKFLKTDYPFTEGLELGTTKLSDSPNLTYDEDVNSESGVGID